MVERRNGFCISYAVKQTSDKGLGVFANEPIKRGSIVWRYVPDQFIVHNEQTFMALLENMTHAEVVYELTHVFGMQDFPGCLVRVLDDGVLFNHATDPNLITNHAMQNASSSPDDASPDYRQVVAKALLDDRYAMIATKDIEVGDELTNDYNRECFDPPFYDALYGQYGIDDSYLYAPE